MSPYFTYFTFVTWEIRSKNTLDSGMRIGYIDCKLLFCGWLC